ncbi:alpha-galactosidase [Thalassotalea sp. M1531]|uniref:Alpha-galactosidase n=1 Tax=Thalassotalea algicola TaxID=2716224 RepID=A0A7Y0L9W8_9GAMM|nr:alpha-galactosidase [Thalassotalea algicola]NMP30177.1 alpha-galactosidase [Thalassotalea algicola]
MGDFPEYIHLRGKRSSFIVDISKRLPSVLYWGKLLKQQNSALMLAQLATRQEAKCAAVEEPPLSLMPTYGQGFTGNAGVELISDNQAWSICGDIVHIEQENQYSVLLKSLDNIRKISVIHIIALDPNTDVLQISTELVNHGADSVTVNSCMVATLPIPETMTELTGFEGRWAQEFNTHTIKRFSGGYVRENRKGKTSHDSFPGLLVHSKSTAQTDGICYGFHLGWSGNHKVLCEQLSDGRSYVQLGELLLPGEVVLNEGERYSSPTLYGCFAEQGFNQLSTSFHHYVRQQLLRNHINDKPRPIHYNTWEGIYFDHDIDTLVELAKQAAALGAERFVLDDGWFKGRRGDFAGLGDWEVDKEIYPKGLQPLIEQVLAQGMEFGIWFEPEMVNPDSDLYRAHPDWVLSSAGNEQLIYRNQLVLDLTNTEVTQYLYQAIDAILQEYSDISYIKWDMNRDINHAGNLIGKPAVHRQTLALYQLIERLKLAHPNVDIESCSSGGGRVDYGILKHTDRVWTSDSNDALDRLNIQRGCSYFFPSNIMGSHVGPRDCHITGRRISIEMRAAVAMFGHMGIEMDPRELTEHERVVLREAISLHKKYRQLIHQGELVRMDSGDNEIRFAIVNDEQSHGLFSYNLLAETLRYAPDKFYFAGLKEEAKYRLNLVWPTKVKEYSTSVLSVVDGQVFSGEALMAFGMQLPIIDPQSSLIFEVSQIK